MAYKQELWDEAKKKCHLGEEEIRMAKEMGLNPKSFIKNMWLPTVAVAGMSTGFLKPYAYTTLTIPSTAKIAYKQKISL